MCLHPETPFKTGFQCSWSFSVEMEKVVKAPGWALLQYGLGQVGLPGDGNSFLYRKRSSESYLKETVSC